MEIIVLVAGIYIALMVFRYEVRKEFKAIRKKLEEK